MMYPQPIELMIPKALNNVHSRRQLNFVKCVLFAFQGARFMSTAMYDAREAMIPGSVYDRSNTGETFILICHSWK